MPWWKVLTSLVLGGRRWDLHLRYRRHPEPWSAPAWLSLAGRSWRWRGGRSWWPGMMIQVIWNVPLVIISYSCYAYRDREESQFGLFTLDKLLEHKTCGETADHVAKEPEGPDQVDGVYINPSVPKTKLMMPIVINPSTLPCQVWLSRPHHRSDKPMSKLCQPRHREVDRDPSAGVGVKSQHHLHTWSKLLFKDCTCLHYGSI